MLVVGGFEKFGGALRAEHGGRAEHQRGLSCARQPLGDLCLDRVDDQAAADRRAWRDRRVEAVDRHHRVAHGRAGVEHEVGEVVELHAVRVP